MEPPYSSGGLPVVDFNVGTVDNAQFCTAVAPYPETKRAIRALFACFRTDRSHLDRRAPYHHGRDSCGSLLVGKLFSVRFRLLSLAKEFKQLVSSNFHSRCAKRVVVFLAWQGRGTGCSAARTKFVL